MHVLDFKEKLLGFMCLSFIFVILLQHLKKNNKKKNPHVIGNTYSCQISGINASFVHYSKQIVNSKYCK